MSGQIDRQIYIIPRQKVDRKTVKVINMIDMTRKEEKK